MEKRIVGLETAVELLKELKNEIYKIAGNATISPDDANGRVIARELCSPRSVPAEPESMVDGYALGSPGREFRVTGSMFADGTADGTTARLDGNGAVYVTTGSPLPAGTVAVAMAEDCVLDGDELKCPPQDEFVNVRRAGDDIEEGHPLLKPGDVVTPASAALVTSLGIEAVEVLQKPRVAVLPTGDEVVSKRVPSMNSAIAGSYLQNWCCEPVILDAVGDEPGDIEEAIDSALEYCHAMIMSGGTAAGARDYSGRVLSGTGFELLFSGVDVRPGHHSKLATFSGKPVLALPGRPAAFLAGLHVLARPLLAAAPAGKIQALPPGDSPPPENTMILMVRLDETNNDLPRCVMPSSPMLASAYIIQRAGERLTEPCNCVLLD